jgi:hypothetical protein
VNHHPTAAQVVIRIPFQKNEGNVYRYANQQQIINGSNAHQGIMKYLDYGGPQSTLNENGKQ